MSGPVSEGLAAYLTRTWEAPVEIVDLARISGGASRETYRFDAMVGGERRPLILRRDPPGSLIETDRRSEFLALKSFHGRGVAAPEPLILELEGAELERPFFIMARIDGGATASPFAPDPYAPNADAIADDFFSTLGRIAAADPATLPIAEVVEPPALDQCWKRELDYWSGVIVDDELHPQPIVRAAIRWLYAHPPPPAQKLSVVHGDYRSGNFLHDGAGRIIAVLDWEMAHIGDPLEDLGWALDPLWRHTNDSDQVGGMCTKADAIAHLGGRQRAEGRSRRVRLVGGVRLGEGPGDLDLLGQGVPRQRLQGADPLLFRLVHRAPPGRDPGRAPEEAGGMTPNVRDVLQGVVVALASPPSPEVGMIYAASRMGMVSTLTMLAAAEADRAAHDAALENADIRALFAEADRYDDDGALAAVARETDADLSVPALDAANARLRRQLIALHERVETAGDAAMNRQIVALYVRMAQIRRMALGGG